MIGCITCDSGLGPKQVAPFGGSEARLGTNPLAVAFPSELEGPVFLDMATSTVAAGKIEVLRTLGQTTPHGWLIDKHGQPTTDPAAYFDGGAILPLGGAQGHKGYGLSFMVETFSGLLTGLGFGIAPHGRHNDGAFLTVFNVDVFRPLDEFKRDMADFVASLKQTPPVAGFDEVLYPGELEYRTAQMRRREGIPVAHSTWMEIMSLYEAFGLTLPESVGH